MTRQLKRTERTVAPLAVAALIVSGFAGTAAQPPAGRTPARIVSLIPAVTEMLFAIGAGPQVVAVSSFDEFPPEVARLPRVGALLDPDLERILALRPDLVAVYENQTDLRTQLARAAVPIFPYKHGGLADVTGTIRQVGAAAGREKDAAAVIDRIRDHLQRIRSAVAGRARPRAVLVISRDALTLRGIYASGGLGFLHDMLGVAGGENVFADVRQESVQATTELILARKPDVIIELRPGEIAPEREAREVAAWNALAAVPAVRNKRIVLLTDPRTVVPGPRVAEGTELLARALHPDAFRP